MARFHTQGRDPLVTPRQTVWQRERARGAILPMEEPRRWRHLFRRAGR